MINLNNLTVEERITRAKIQMYKRSPFFAYILLHMKMQKEDGCPTMGVDAKGNLYWDEEFVKSISEEELMSVICHETLHIALMHLERGEGKERSVFNIANDLVVNDVLNQENFKLPTCGMIPTANHRFNIFNHEIENIHEKSSEEIYSEIYPLVPKINIAMNMLNHDEGDGKNSGSGSGLTKKERQEAKEKLKGIDEHKYGSGTAEEEGEGEGQNGSRSKIDRQQKWKKIISEAAQLAKQQGLLPAGLERRIDGILDSKMNWKQKLYKYVIAQLIHDYTWSSPNKRTASLGIYLPRPMKESVHIIVSIDTSGSIGNDELKEFLSELIAIWNSFVNINMDIIIVDAEVHETYTLTKDNVEDIMQLKMSGGGGTNHIPVYDYIVKNIQDTKVLINFTDGWTSFPDNPEEYPFETLWVINKNGCSKKDIPFGEVIKLE